MFILAHRGYWSKNAVNNSPEAIKTALESGFGFESDVRDYRGDLVISHDIATKKAQKAEEVFKWLSEFDNKFCFAINIKADGLKQKLASAFNKYGIKNYFLFDMSVPQMVEFSEMGLRFFTRQSEVEKSPVMYGKASGVWIDGFWGTEWITCDLIKAHIKAGKEVCLVSPELHGADNYKDFWQMLKEGNMKGENIYLCTDHPEEARVFLGK